MPRSSIIFLAVMAFSAECSAGGKLPRDADAYRLFPAAYAKTNDRTYTIGALDTIAVTVFQKPDLTVRDLQVDAGGKVVLPLIGSIDAAGLTATQLAANIAEGYSRGLLIDPQVAVVVEHAISQKVTVEGSVTEPGIYELQGPTSLLDALAMAKGTTRVASLGDVAIFRQVNGTKVGAVFDVKRISAGEQADPEILGNDTIVVGHSGLKAAWRDVLTAAPLAAALRPF